MFIELTSKDWDNENKVYVEGEKFLVDLNNGWEILDRGEEPAHWVNNILCMNKSVAENYAQIKLKLKQANLFAEYE